ncbi:MAG: type ISP restriction/modification enzyme, partial [Chloroflexota bacterium]
QGGVTMPGKGRIVERPYTADQRQAIAAGAAALGLGAGQAFEQLGQSICDIYLNDGAYWRNVPVNVWAYTIGGYQVMKKWLSYRERQLLGRPLRLEEIREVQNMARRLAALLLLQPRLDANYQAVKGAAFPWSSKKA